MTTNVEDTRVLIVFRTGEDHEENSLHGCRIQLFLRRPISDTMVFWNVWHCRRRLLSDWSVAKYADEAAGWSVHFFRGVPVSCFGDDVLLRENLLRASYEGNHKHITCVVDYIWRIERKTDSAWWRTAVSHYRAIVVLIILRGSEV